MKLKLKAIGLAFLFLLVAWLILQALMAWASLEATKSDDYFYVKTGWVNEPVLEVKNEYQNALR